MSDTIKQAGANLAKKAQAADRLREYWESLPEATRTTLKNSLVGSAIGGLLGGGAGYMAGDSAAKNALIGALLGGAATGAGTLGWQLVRGGLHMPGENLTRRNVLDELSDRTVTPVIYNPGTAAGAGIGLGTAALRWPYQSRIQEAMMHRATQLGLTGGRTPTAMSGTAGLEDIYNALKRGTRFSGGVDPAGISADAATALTRHPVRTAAEAATGHASPVTIRALADMVRKGGAPGRGAASALEWAARQAAAERYLGELGLYGRGLSSKPALAGIALAATGIGHMVDRYLKGQNQ